MSLACRFYVMFMSFMLILYEMFLLDIQSFTALIMSYVIKYGHFSFTDSYFGVRLHLGNENKSRFVFASHSIWINFSRSRKQINWLSLR